MASPFVSNLLKPLALSQPPSPITESHSIPFNTVAETQSKRSLRYLLFELNSTQLSESIVNDTLGTLIQIEHATKNQDTIKTVDTVEEDALKRAVINQLVIGLYAESLDLCISQAAQSEAEAEWWADIERSRRNVAWYLFQTLPGRLINLGSTIVQTFRTQNVPLRISSINPTLLRQLFPSPDSFHPGVFVKALFPHLHHQQISVASSAILFSSQPSNGAEKSFFGRLSSTLNQLTWLPLELTRQECMYKRRELGNIRDRKAEALGRLAQLRGNLFSVVKSQPWNTQAFVHVLTHIVGEEISPAYSPASVDTRGGEDPSPLLNLLRLSTVVFASRKAPHTHIISHNLQRPSHLTLIWPKLLLLPPLCLVILRSAYTSRATLVDVARDAQETAYGFVKGWLIEPIKDVLQTVRAGGEGGMIVRKEGVTADFDSLERMALALAKDELHYGPEQLTVLSQQIRLGDLTPVLQLYEEDIKRPFKSVVTGTLLRSMFIQVQKAKVDIDQALAGIDKLLKSQELTFAFVGVAPAFGILYVLKGLLATMWRGGRGLGKYGGKRRTGSVWVAMRRTEQLLICQPKSRRQGDVDGSGDHPISPLTTGLLLLSVAHLRTYAETCLPARSRLREGFLEDVSDLENPDLGRVEKLRVVERMWRCWGDILGWSKIGGDGTPSK
ncbi:ATP synthase regulation protein NCA2-domain-containing protein [Collybia nuda]|uniref:ATP synthase regulation protein NCA2-domain-containing protein n=1 Tax=Collybia nuda TaxID=64659 RepID=A0A9P6CNP2_9AGAR|nr:ATP synthase regulation protein NCA2-domain-containing protein [Collybia nuda]